MLAKILAVLVALVAGITALVRKRHPKKPPVPPPTGGPAPLPRGRHLTLIVQTTNVTAEQVAAYLAAQQVQIDRDFSPYWGGSAVIDRQPGGWPVYLQDLADIQNALGYHDVDSTGEPFAKVFILTSKQAGVNWEAVASHEVLEVLGDSNTQTTDLGPDGCQWVQETGDPVEAYSYFVNSVQLSDFVLPSWFTLGAKGPYDFANHLTAPFTIAPGGYALEVCNGQIKVVGGETARSVDRHFNTTRPQTQVFNPGK